jgi:hypothetical protein
MKAVSSTWAKGLVAALVLMSVSSMALAATDVTGTWTWAQNFGRRGGGGGGGGGGGAGGAGGRAAPMATAKLTQKGDTVTGTIQFPARGRRGGDAGGDTPPPAPTPVEIKNGKISGDTLSFEVTQTRGNNEVTTKYSGKVEGDKITGTQESPGRDGNPMSREWTATRQKEGAKS